MRIVMVDTAFAVDETSRFPKARDDIPVNLHESAAREVPAPRMKKRHSDATDDPKSR